MQIPRETVLIPNDINVKKGMLLIFKIITKASSFIIALVLWVICMATPFGVQAGMSQTLEFAKLQDLVSIRTDIRDV